MRKLLTIVLLGGTFLLGYYVGRLPGAPDLTPYARSGYAQASAAYRHVSHWAGQEWEKINAASQERAALGGSDQAASEAPD